MLTFDRYLEASYFITPCSTPSISDTILNILRWLLLWECNIGPGRRAYVKLHKQKRCEAICGKTELAVGGAEIENLSMGNFTSNPSFQ